MPRLSPRSFTEKVYKGRVGICTVYQLFLSAVAAIANPCGLLFAHIAPECRFVDARETPGSEEQHGQGEGNELRD
jgi:hypothetical protein